MPSFEGIPFRNWRDYDYATARRALVSAMGQLCRHPLLKKEYGITPRCWVRRRIKDEDWYVWDSLRLLPTAGSRDFRKVPHLTLAIRRDDVFVRLNFPNEVKASERQMLADLGIEGLTQALRQTLAALRRELQGVSGWVPVVEVVQRHWDRGRSALPTYDARLSADLRTALPPARQSHGGGGPKYQPAWLQAAYGAFVPKPDANIRLGVGIVFPYEKCGWLAQPRSLDRFAHAWVGCRHLVDATNKNAISAARSDRGKP